MEYVFDHAISLPRLLADLFWIIVSGFGNILRPALISSISHAAILACIYLQGRRLGASPNAGSTFSP
jgi:hypothetical protein